MASSNARWKGPVAGFSIPSGEVSVTRWQGIAIAPACAMNCALSRPFLYRLLGRVSVFTGQQQFTVVLNVIIASEQVMDRLIYTAMSGAKQSLDRQSVVANNMANVSTNGFRAELNAARAVPIQGSGMPTRSLAVESTPGSDFSAGQISTTGRALDVAISGDGWLAVLTPEGETAYTRDGGLQLDSTGMLRSGGNPVMGDDGPIVLPPDAVDVSIGADGTISVRQPGAQVVNEEAQLMLADNPGGRMQRREDGLFAAYDAEGQPVEALMRDEDVRVVSGAIESSNVNPTEAMVAMIDAARSFEMHMKMISSIDESSQRANSLLSMS